MLRVVAVVALVAVALVAVRAQEGEEHEDEFHPFEYYSYDGAFNNPSHPDWGIADSHFSRRVPPAYADGVYRPIDNRPHPRDLSMLQAGPGGQDSLSGRTVFFTHFGQQVVEELLDGQRPGCAPEYTNYKLIDNDPLYGDVLEQGFYPLRRGRYDFKTGKNPGVPREQLNEISPWIDGTLMYGPLKAWADAIRQFSNGRLAEDPNNPGFPIRNFVGLPIANAPPSAQCPDPSDPTVTQAGRAMDGVNGTRVNGTITPCVPTSELRNAKRFFVFGNPRTNENPFLMSMALILFRLHNVQAERVQREHPTWNDEQVFNEARKWTIAIYQHLVLDEWIPALFNEPLCNETRTTECIPTYDGYSSSTFPGITHVFQSAAMRFGHTLVALGTTMMDNDCSQQKIVRTCNSYFRSHEEVYDNRTFNQMVLGMSSQLAEKEDNVVVEDLRGFVFGPLEWHRRDLMYINIVRAREHGIPDYNTVRRNFGLEPNTFENITADPTLAANLRAAYGGDDTKIDLWTGGIHETTAKGPGSTFRAIILDQFVRIRRGDRFWYENPQNGLFNQTEIDHIKSMSMRDVVVAVTTNAADPASHMLDHSMLPLDLFHAAPVSDPDPLRRAPCFRGAVGHDEVEPCTEPTTFDWYQNGQLAYILIFGVITPLVLCLLVLFICVRRARRRAAELYYIDNARPAKDGAAAGGSSNRIAALVHTDVSRFGTRETQVDVELKAGALVVLNQNGEVYREISVADVSQVHGSTDGQWLLVRQAGRRHPILFSFERIGLARVIAKLPEQKVEAPLAQKALIMQYMDDYCAYEEQLAADFENLSQGTVDEAAVVNDVFTRDDLSQLLRIDRNTEFMDRLFQVSDEDQDGVISRADLAKLLQRFRSPDQKDRLRLFFDLFDLEKRGYVTIDDMVSLVGTFGDLGGKETSQLQSTHSRQLVVDSMFAAVHQEPTQRIDFDLFVKLMAANADAVSLRNPVKKSGARLTRKDHTTKNKWEQYRFYLKTHRLQVAWLMLFFIGTGLIFGERAYVYSTEAEVRALRTIAGYGVTTTRGAASAMMWCFSVILIPMLRNIITFLRTTELRHVIPFDNALDFHKIVAYTGLFFIAVHIVGHVINFYHISTQPAGDMACFFREIQWASNFHPSYHWWLFETVTGLSGYLCLLTSMVIYTFAQQIARRTNFNLFWATHQLYVVFYILCILHGAAKLVQDPYFWYFFVGPGGLFVLDRLFTFTKSARSLQLVAARTLPGRVVQLVITRPPNFAYLSGQWLRIRIPAVSPWEWHAFTISSAPHEQHLTLHIRCVGHWTNACWRLVHEVEEERKRAAREGTEPQVDFPFVNVEGPFGEGHQEWKEYETSILVGAGIGVTPFVSIIKEIGHLLRLGVPMKTKKVHFIWVCRSQKQYEWLVDVIRQLEKGDPDKRLECHIFITNLTKDFRTAFLFAFEQQFRTARGVSLFTNLRAKTYFGRPDFTALFRELTDSANGKKVGVFSCGSPAVTNGVEQGARSHNQYVLDNNTTCKQVNHYYVNF